MVFATPQVFGLLIFNGLFDNVLSQFAWAKASIVVLLQAHASMRQAVQWTSPTTATVPFQKLLWEVCDLCVNLCEATASLKAKVGLSLTIPLSAAGSAEREGVCQLAVK